MPPRVESSAVASDGDASKSANEVRSRLEQIGLSQYVTAFLDEGFDTWESIVDITESDLNALNVKLGHRRKLQRAIADSITKPSSSSPLPLDRAASSVEGSVIQGSFTSITRLNRNPSDQTEPILGTGKRKYRRHPKIDNNAPERPASAYVLFSNHVRDSLKAQDMSFTAIAKTVGERWQLLAPGDKDKYEREAAANKDIYYAQMNEYKKTPQYAEYQEYLAQFHGKQSGSQQDSTWSHGKRARSDGEDTTPSTASVGPT